jgi:eukaryotic-like serine/threonine-protein kinase
MPLPPGTHLGPYEILEQIGAGGMGAVYKARDARLGREVAIKVLPPDKMADPDRKRRFIQEARSASALNHPHIVIIHDIGESDGIDFIVMEYVEGRTLDQFIPRDGMKSADVLKYAIPVADALAAAHAAGIVHRDLKPANVIVSRSEAVKVLDFGLAKLTAPETEADDKTRTMANVSQDGAIVGTAAYMSPEQAEGRPVDARSDIFSFGAMLYEMLTGHKAFTGKTTVSTLAAVLRHDPAPRVRWRRKHLWS